MRDSGLRAPAFFRYQFLCSARRNVSGAGDVDEVGGRNARFFVLAREVVPDGVAEQSRARTRSLAMCGARDVVDGCQLAFGLADIGHAMSTRTDFVRTACATIDQLAD